MAISAVSPVSVPTTESTSAKTNFKGKKDNQIPEGYKTVTYNGPATTGKKWGVGVASTFLPGLGQAINGNWGKGIGFLLGTCAASFTSKALAGTGNFIGAGIAGFGALGLSIWSIVDAVKNAKSEVTQIVPDDKKLDVNA